MVVSSFGSNKQVPISGKNPQIISTEQGEKEFKMILLKAFIMYMDWQLQLLLSEDLQGQQEGLLFEVGQEEPEQS